MSTKFVFNFNSKFLSATPMPAPHARKSKLMTRRAEMRTRRQWDCEESISTAPAMVDIDVVACVPEAVVDEMITMSPVILAAESAASELGLAGTIPTTPAVTSIKSDEIPASAIKPAHDDRETQNSSSAENANWGIPPQNDATEFPGHASSEIVPAAEITGTLCPMTAAPAVSLAANSGDIPISTDMLDGITPADVPLAPAKKVRRRSNAAGKTKKPRTKSGTEMDEAGTSQETDGQNRPPGYGPNDGSYAHSPPKTTQLAERELRDAGTGRGLKPRPLTSDEVTGAASSSVRL
jgi:hypothetical protein